MNSDLSHIFELPLADQLELVEELWDHIAASNQSIPVPQWQRDELDRRKQSFSKNPQSAISWDDAREQIRKQDD